MYEENDFSDYEERMLVEEEALYDDEPCPHRVTDPWGVCAECDEPTI